MMITGLENIGVVTFQKEMRFGLDFRFLFAKRIFGFIVTLIAAWILRTYWALVIGMLSMRTFGLVLSYVVHEMRPRFSFARFRDIFAVSQWLLVNSIGAYLSVNLHKLLVGRRSDTATMGAYSLADEISAMPSSELLAPLNRVLFPAFVEVKHDLSELRRKFLIAQGVQCLVGIPVGVGLSLVAEEVVLILLGEKWRLAVPFVQMLAITNALVAVTTSGSYVLMALGRISMVALTSWSQVMLFVVAVLVVLPEATALEIAWIRFGTASVGTVILFIVLRSILPSLRLYEVGTAVVRPLVAIAAMSVAVLGVGTMPGLSLPMMLTLKVMTGALVYVSVVFVGWLVTGRPAGAEAYLLEKASTVLPSLARLGGKSA
jgi:O-antigen/teichoic acid export membrane protein